MTDREKLIELLLEGIRADNEKKEAWILGGKVGEKPSVFENMADHLIANGVTVQEWISVKDRLPDEDGKYLVFEQSGGRTVTSVLRFAKDARKVDRYDFSRRKNAWYEYDSEWGHYIVNSVTHWMPLPQPPKGE